MNKKFLAIIVCLAMLVSNLAVGVYAVTVDVEIDLSDLFGPSDSDNNEGTEDGEGGNAGEDNTTGEDEKEENPSRPSRPSRPSTETDTTPDDEEDEDLFSGETTTEDEKKEWVNPFSDVKDSDWYYETVKYVSENGIFNGMTDDTFVPGGELTRAMLVTVLYRVEGSPRLESDGNFSDVDLDDWFGAPVIWAAENGIVNGVSDTEFAPNNAITREQIAAIMFRYAKAKGYDVSVGENTNILSYDDFDSISEYAIEAIQYTSGSGLMKGKTESTINPQDKATRAEAATVVMRFIEANK